MDDKLRQELRAKRIREMKNPTILMNENDFEGFKKEIESKTTVVVDDNPTYEGVPIKVNNIIQSGNIVIYDDVSHNWLPFFQDIALGGLCKTHNQIKWKIHFSTGF